MSKSIKIMALNTIVHNGKNIGPGEIFEADKKLAEYLTNQNAAEVYVEKPKIKETEPVNAGKK